ncbi:hypothetical protein NBT09_04880 [Rickettsia conorii subsp. raoultii]|uniref:Uncharacterized protein n=1 Tax=Rickettsia conorii subsp. raoultii TaxID=369822 RepID=A0ABY4U1D8_RICCR|nr:hypothetical protein [Rickettsia rhipicephali]URW78465.1 hypothetical protein NBT09_04880 [Rickettsia conorii subsp. raoultii]
MFYCFYGPRGQATG